MEELLKYLEAKAHNINDVYVRSIEFELRHADRRVKAHNDGFGSITLYMATIAEDARYNGESLAIEAAKTLAHEFRHLDQAQAWDELPQVRPMATEMAMTRGDTGWASAYAEDPGEADAQRWAEDVVENIPEDVLASWEQFIIDLIALKRREQVERRLVS